MDRGIEIFRDIPEYEDYLISNWGRIKSLSRWVICNGGKRLVKEKILKPIKHDGYDRICLCQKNSKHIYFIHQLMGKVFLPNPNNLSQINHKDENVGNNFIWINEDGSIDPDKSNLEWVTPSYNVNWGTRNLRVSKKMFNRPDESKPIYRIYKGQRYYYLSIKEAARQIGYSDTMIRYWLSKKHKPRDGSEWEYA